MQSLKSRLLYRVVKYQLAKLIERNLPLPEYRLAREEAASRLFRMWHVWQTLAGRMREADQSVDELGAFLSAHLHR